LRQDCISSRSLKNKEPMTKNQLHLIDKYYLGGISRDKFLKEFGGEIENPEFIREELKKAINSKDEDQIERAINLMWLHNDNKQFIDELNILLLDTNHTRHQEIAKTIQDLANPKSIPFIKKALESKFDYLQYTCSESDAIAKWFSWALFSIGTKEAINIIKEYTESDDEGIKNEMIYRLKKVNRSLTNKK